MLSACGPPAAWSMRLLAVVALLLAEERITRLHEYTQSRRDYERICQSRAVFLGTVGLGGRRPPVLLQKVSSFVRAFVDARRQVRRNARTSISPGRVCPALPFWPLLLRPRLLHSEPAFRAGLALAQSPKAKRDRSAAWRIGGAWICPSKTCRVTVDPTMCMSIGETDATCAADHRGVRRCWYNYMVACG